MLYVSYMECFRVFGGITDRRGLNQQIILILWQTKTDQSPDYLNYSFAHMILCEYHLGPLFARLAGLAHPFHPLKPYATDPFQIDCYSNRELMSKIITSFKYNLGFFHWIGLILGGTAETGIIPNVKRTENKQEKLLFQLW